ncbi:hypothetical protein [Acidithiobacillus sp.]|uniref:DUF6197 family protein n=1 Tax=Acidithiobacillus sp. TaxID=1872118 RepID=UPI00258F6871|nr:hypothetical protein [Acidithiobacillus sp.]MDD5374457.1 hypothetical protein [Acidithiobacillus sp.]
MKTIDVLRRARRRILRNGWGQGMYRVHGAYCALGAIRLGPRGKLDLGPATNRAEGYLANVVGQNRPIAMWNDTPGRLKGEVILAFDRAIKNAKRRHPKGD